GSMVLLNSLSELTYKKSSWNDNREVHLQGEAYFQVEKGNRFTVVTSAGNVSVLGTHFNVKQRGNYFEVTCFEGLVAVKTPTDSILLPAGKNFQIINGRVKQGITDRVEPNLTTGISSFESVPFKEVLAEFERQYNVA